MLREEPIRRYEIDGVVVEYRLQLPGPYFEPALDFNYVVMHISNSVTLELSVDNERISRRIVPGDLHVLPQGRRLESHLSASCALLVIALFDTALIQLGGDGDTTCRLRPYLAIRDLHLQNFLAAMREELRHGCPAGAIYLRDLIRTLIRYLVRRYSTLAESPVFVTPDGLPPNRLRLVLDYMHRHLDGELTLNSMATLVQMSPQHFANLFRKSTGVAPHQYVLRERLETARCMLLETNRPIADIALEVGFASQSHFTDVFHKMLGYTPSRYRRQFSQWVTSEQRTEQAS